MSGMPPPVTMVAPSFLRFCTGPAPWLVSLLTSGPILGRGRAGRASWPRPSFRGSDELVENRALTRTRARCPGRPGRVLEARAGYVWTALSKSQVGEYHGGVLAAQFQRHRADAVGGGLRWPCRCGFAGEGDAVHVGWEVRKAHRRSGRNRCTTLNALGHADRSSPRPAAWRCSGFFRRFDHHGVAAGQRQADLQVISSSGRFHGQTTAITPRGTRTPERGSCRRGAHLEGLGRRS